VTDEIASFEWDLERARRCTTMSRAINGLVQSVGPASV
jgi:hypothetical protein